MNVAASTRAAASLDRTIQRRSAQLPSSTTDPAADYNHQVAPMPNQATIEHATAVRA